MYTINYKTLYKDSDSIKYPRGETYKSTKAILKIPQETYPDNFQVKAPSARQSVFQAPIKLNNKERAQLKCQRYFQVPIQGPKQLIYQIESNMATKGFPRDMPSIMSAGTVFGESSGDTSGSTSDKPTTHSSPVKIIKPSSGTSENPTKNTSHVTKELKSANAGNILIEYSSGYPTGPTSTK